MKWMLLMFLILGTVLPLEAAQQYNEATCILLKHEIAREKLKRGNDASVYYSQTQKRFDTHCQNPIVVQQKKVSTSIKGQANKPIATQVKAPPIYVKPKPLITKTAPQIDGQARKSPPMVSSTSLLPIFVLLIIGLTLFYSLKKKLPQIKGKIGESIVKKGLEKHLDSDKYTILNDVTLPLEDGGTTQIDHIVVSNFGIFVIETKNMSGWIFGSEHQSKWTQAIHRSKYPFQNPLRQNYKHTKTLSMLLDIPHSRFHPVVVFTRNAELKTKMPDNVGYLNGMLDYINSFNTELIDHKLKLRLLEHIDIIKLKQGRKTDKQHVSYLKDRKHNHSGL